MNKLLVTACCAFVWSANAQNEYYYAPVISLHSLDQPMEKVGHDFGLVITDNNFVKKGYYLWLDNQWYEIVNAQKLFHTTANGLAFYIDWAKKEDLKIKDALDVTYSYPIEAIDTYKSNESQYEQLAQIIIEQPIATNQQEEKIQDKQENSPLLDVIDIKEEVVRKEIPFATPKENAKEEKNIATTTVEIITPAEIVDTDTFENPYEKAVKAGFEGSVTEWIEMVTEKEGKSPYEKALAQGYDRSETDYMRMLWGSKVNPEIDRKERDTKYVLEWIDKIKTSDGSTPYELALKHGFYGSFTEWVESVIGKDGEAIYNQDVKNGYKGTYRSWIESKLKESNDELSRKELLRKRNFIMVPNIVLSVPENPEEISTFSLYNYYQMYYGGAVISSNTNAQTVEIKPEEIEYQISWYNNKEIKINSISQEGIIYYQRAEDYLGNNTHINVRYIIK